MAGDAGSAGEVTRHGNPERLVLFEDQRLLGTGLDALAGEFLIAWLHFVRLQDRIAGVVDWKKVRINRIALRMTHALGVVDANFHAITLPKLG